MIKVGFIGSVSKEWMGGLNYFKNLLFAINSIEEKELEVFVFVGKKIDIKFGDQSYTQLSKRAGNGWDVNLVTILLEHIFKQLKEIDTEMFS